jgi:hypothetical protein
MGLGICSRHAEPGSFMNPYGYILLSQYQSGRQEESHGETASEGDSQ